ncbi:hypothetical protein BDW60DRAFT_201562 [Aspergillus nidulans var. acristatus]
MPDGSGVRRYRYLNLRARIQAHIQDGSQPELGLLERPVGGPAWEPMSTHKTPEIELEYDQEESRSVIVGS